LCRPGCLAGSQRLKQGFDRLFRVLYGLYGIVHATTSLQPGAGLSAIAGEQLSNEALLELLDV
jgi:hypothetical protein